MRGLLVLIVGAALMVGAAWLAVVILGLLGIHVYWPSWLPRW